MILSDRAYTGRDRVVGIATLYGLDGPGFEPRRGRYFPYLSRPVFGLSQPPVQGVPLLLPRGKAGWTFR
jgi:hypothetical protein